MTADPKTRVSDALADLPDRDEIRRRLAENLQDRLLLRQLLKLVEQRDRANATVEKGAL